MEIKHMTIYYDFNPEDLTFVLDWNVADPDPGSGAFYLTPGTGMEQKSGTK